MKKIIFLLTSLFVNVCYSQVSFTLNTNVCSGVTNTLTANTGTDITLSYTWAISPSTPVFSSPNASVTTINIPTSGIYIVSLNVTLSSGFGSYSSTVNVTQTPTISLAQSATTVCMINNFPKSSQLVTFTASGSSAGYTWNPILFSPGANTSIGMVNTGFPVCYTVSSTVGSCIGKAVGCITIIPQYSITVSPSSATICSSDSLQLNVSGVSSLAILPIQKYKWSDPSPVSIANASVNPARISPSVTSTYTVETVDNDGCVSLPTIVTVSVVSCTGIFSNSLDETILSVYPNPANDILTVKTENGIKLKIIDVLGQLIKEEDLNNADKNKNIDIRNLQNGIYFLQMFDKEKLIGTAKILKE